MEIEATSLQAAREEAKSRTPAGLQILSEQIVWYFVSLLPRTVKEVGATVEDALWKAQGQVKEGEKIISDERRLPSQEVIEVQALDEETARIQARKMIDSTSEIVEMRVKTQGKKGFWGIGRKKPNIYEAKSSNLRM